MHGKKREEYKTKLRDTKTAIALENKAIQWHTLMKELYTRRRQMQQQEFTEHKAKECTIRDDNEDGSNNPIAGSSKAETAKTLSLLEKALLVNPDPLSLWNFRREMLLKQLQQEENEEQQAENYKSKLLETEQSLTKAALQRNPKSYGGWYHRKWIIQFVKPSKATLGEELVLTGQFLQMDERNFHCWNYRRFIVACIAQSWTGEWTVVERSGSERNDWTINNKLVSLMGPQVAINATKDLIGDDLITMNRTTIDPVIPQELIQSEFDFTTTKIQDNFSNFSAFHYRSQLIDYVKVNSLEEQILQEFQLIEDAICTEPDDQTSWWYHSILLDKIQYENNNNTELLDSLTPRFIEQADLFRELLDDSPLGKWILLGLFRVLQIMDSDDLNQNKEEQKSILNKLIKIDPDRSQRYHELLQRID